MSLGSVHGEVETSEAAVAPASATEDARLEQLTVARNADQIWRSGRKAELDLLIRRSFLLVCLYGCVLIVGTRLAMRLLTPYVAQTSWSWLSAFWEIAENVLCPIIGVFVGIAFGNQLRPLVAEKKAYDEAPDEPVVWSTGLVIHPPAREEAAPPPVPAAESSARTVVWSTGTVIALSDGPETPPCTPRKP